MISVVIPHYLHLEYLERCLISLENQMSADVEIIVVDNGATGECRRWLRENFPGVRLVELFPNQGFAVAVNAGIKESRGEFIFLLSNDTEIAPGCLEAFRQGIEETGADFLSPLLLFRDNGRINSSGDFYLRSGQAGNRGLNDPPGHYPNAEPVFGSCGGAVFFRKNLFNPEEVGLFQERLFMYYEDVEWNLRANLLGYRAWFYPAAIVYHIGAGTVGKRSAFRDYYCERNLLLTIFLDWPLSTIIGNLPFILYYQLKSSLRLFRQGWGIGLAALAGKGAFLKALGQWSVWQSRFSFQRKRKSFQKAGRKGRLWFDGAVRY